MGWDAITFGSSLVDREVLVLDSERADSLSESCSLGSSSMIGVCFGTFGLLGFVPVILLLILCPESEPSAYRLLSDFLLLLAVSAGAAGVGIAASSARAFLIDLFVRTIRCVRVAAALPTICHAEPGSVEMGSASASSLAASCSACSDSRVRFRSSSCSFVATISSRVGGLTAFLMGLIPIPLRRPTASLVCGDQACPFPST